MNRKDFLKRLFAMYPNTFTTGENGNGKVWREAYEEVLKEKWDYDKLFSKMVTKYQHTHIAPAPAFFVDFIEDIKPQNKCDALKNIDILKGIEHQDPSPETQQKIAEFKQKINSNSEKFQVYGGKYD